LEESVYSYQLAQQRPAQTNFGAAEERQPNLIVIKEEKEQMLMFSQVDEKEHHSKEWIKIFSQEVEQEITAELKPTTEKEADNIDFVNLYEELESPERRVIVQSKDIQ
jgi:hypothetical protein